jgi:hypothetical protein
MMLDAYSDLIPEEKSRTHSVIAAAVINAR